MSLFNFKIKGTKAKEEKEYKVSYVKAGQKEKVCGVCAAVIPIGASATTFMKQLKLMNDSKKFLTQHTCGHKETACTQEMARRLQVYLP